MQKTLLVLCATALSMMAVARPASRRRRGSSRRRFLTGSVSYFDNSESFYHGMTRALPSRA